MSDITVTITSCGRFDLLERTLDSFLTLNTYPVAKILISEDSGNEDIKNKIINKYGNKVEVLFNEINLGLLRSLDNLMGKVETDYVFHCEDDWEFRGNPNFLKESKVILDYNAHINQVWLRHDIPSEWYEPSILTCNDVEYRMIGINHLDNWSGFSFNPGLRRLSDYKKIFPEGYQKHLVKDLPFVHSEYACNHQANLFNYRAAILKNPCCYHIGENRTTETKEAQYLILTEDKKIINGTLYRLAYVRV